MATRGDAGDLQARGIGNRVDSFYFPPRHRDRLNHEAIGGPLNDREIDHRIFCVDRQFPFDRDLDHFRQFVQIIRGKFEPLETRHRSVEREDRRTDSQSSASHGRTERGANRRGVIGRHGIGNRFEDRGGQRGSTPGTNLRRAEGAVSDIDGELNLPSHTSRLSWPAQATET